MVFCTLSFVNVKKRKQQKGGDVSNCRTGLLLDFERTKQYSFSVGQPKQTDHQYDVGFGCNLFPLFIPTSGCLYSPPSPKTRINRLFLFSISLARHVCLRVSVYVCHRHPPTSAGSGNILCAPATRFSFYVTKIFFFCLKNKNKKMIRYFFTISHGTVIHKAGPNLGRRLVCPSHERKSSRIFRFALRVRVPRPSPQRVEKKRDTIRRVCCRK